MAIGPVASAQSTCPWQNDGDLANALSGSTWHVTTVSTYKVNGATLRLDDAPRSFVMTIAPLLRDIVVDGTALSLRLEPARLPEPFQATQGNMTFRISYPDMSDAPCSNQGLSMLRAEGPSMLDGRYATMTLELWPASEARLAGMIRIERIDAFSNFRATIEPVEAAIQH